MAKPEDMIPEYSTVAYFFRWTFGCFCLLIGLISMLYSSIIFSTIMLIIAILCVPLIYHLIRPNPNFIIGNTAKVFSISIAILCILMGMGAFAISKIMPGFICIVFGTLLFPDVFLFISNKNTQRKEVVGLILTVALASWIGIQYMYYEIENKKNSPQKINSKSDLSEIQKKKKENFNQDNSGAACVMMEDFVKERLKSPSTAKFPRAIEHDVSCPEPGRYIIKSWVDSQNSYGAMIRTYFVCEVKQIDDYKWRLISLEFFDNN